MTEKGAAGKWDRNTQGIKAAAERKRQEAFAKAEEAIKTLVRDKKPINFESVAETAGVTRAWLYKQPDLRNRIEHLRSQRSAAKSIPRNQQASDSSKDAIIKTLRLRIKKLEAENQELRRQVEVAYGLAHADMVASLEAEVADLRRQNNHLMRLLTESRAKNELYEKQ